MPSEKPPGDLRQFKVIHGQEGRPSLEKEEVLSADYFNKPIEEYIASVATTRTAVSIDDNLFRVKKEGNRLIFQIDIEVPKKLMGSKGTVEFVMDSYLEEQMKISGPEIKNVGLINRGFWQELFPKGSIAGLPKYLLEYLEEKKGRGVEKIIVTEQGEFKVFYKEKNGPITSHPNAPVAIDPSIFRAVEREDHAVVEEVISANKEKKSKEETRAQAERAKEEELLSLPRVVELRADYEKRLETLTVAAKKKDAEENLAALNSAPGLSAYFRSRLEKNYDSNDAKALEEIEKINAKYEAVLKKPVE